MAPPPPSEVAPPHPSYGCPPFSAISPSSDDPPSDADAPTPADTVYSSPFTDYAAYAASTPLFPDAAAPPSPESITTYKA